MVRIQILVHMRGVKNKEFGAVTQTDLTNSSVSSVAQASIIHDVLIFVLKVLGSAKSLLSNYVYKQKTNKLTLYCYLLYTIPVINCSWVTQRCTQPLLEQTFTL